MARRPPQRLGRGADPPGDQLSTRYPADAASAVADHVLLRHARESGWVRSLPVPVELIVERTYGLTIEWVELPEPPGAKILGALQPASRRILMNETHAATVFSVVGPLEFTIAHELGHWINDVTPVTTGEQVFCRERTASKTNHREVAANRFAARLLLPADLLGRAVADGALCDPQEFAASCGVSRTTLRIRLMEIGLTQ